VPEDMSPNHAVTEVREEARRLAGELPGRLRRIRLRSGDIAVEVEWQPADVVAVEHNGHPTTLAPTAGADEAGYPADTAPDGDGRQHVVSPMVGTFYHAPEPGANPFVSVGELVEPGRVVGIVEAMKLMNPITAELEGTVVEILAGNAEPVEFGQPLIAIVPA
jgi:acetyl-CoA carboxylase biotin carboxyl carrier protein